MLLIRPGGIYFNEVFTWFNCLEIHFMITKVLNRYVVNLENKLFKFSFPKLFAYSISKSVCY